MQNKNDLLIKDLIKASANTDNMGKLFVMVFAFTPALMTDL